MNGNDFANALHYGLRCFGNIHSIVMTNGLFGTNLNESSTMDSSTLQCMLSGSPVTRNWNPLHGRPRDNTDENLVDHICELR